MPSTVHPILRISCRPSSITPSFCLGPDPGRPSFFRRSRGCSARQQYLDDPLGGRWKVRDHARERRLLSSFAWKISHTLTGRMYASRTPANTSRSSIVNERLKLLAEGLRLVGHSAESIMAPTSSRTNLQVPANRLTALLINLGRESGPNSMSDRSDNCVECHDASDRCLFGPRFEMRARIGLGCQSSSSFEGCGGQRPVSRSSIRSVRSWVCAFLVTSLSYN